MNFDTRTILDILSLDKKLAKEMEDMILEEKKLWTKSGKTSNNEFVKSIAPVIKDTIKISMSNSLNSLKLPHISKYIDYDNVDYFQLIPALAKI